MKRLSKAIKLGIPALILIGLTACSGKSAKLADPTAPPTGYQRQIMLVVENSAFHAIAGADVTIETESPTRLISPADGRGRTNGQGGLLLVFEPLPHYDDAVVAGGDVLADFPIKAKIIVRRSGRTLTTRVLTDRETFARYADPLYQGLNRDPEAGVTYYNIILP